MSIQTFGEQVNFNPHIHVIATDGCFAGDGSFTEAWSYDTSALQEAFMSAVFKMLLKKGMSEKRLELIGSWQHSGFHVFRGPQIHSGDRERLENLARYIVRCPFAMSRLAYQGEMDQVVYRGKTTGGDKVYPALDFLAMLTLQIPAPREQMVRYVGYYSNKCRGMRRKAALPANEPLIIKEARKTASIRWARLIAKVYLDDPLVCPECKGKMRIVAFIDEDAVIVKILKHVGLWERPLAHAPPAPKAVKQNDGFDEYHYQLLPPEHEFEAC